MTIKDERRFWAGILFVAFGALTLVQVPGYALGSPTRMGPGYFPMLVAVVLVALGAMSAWQGIRDGPPAKIGSWPLMPSLFVTLGILTFAALIDRAGLVASVVCLVVLSCYQRILRKPVEVFLIAAAVVVLTAAVFIYAVGLPIAFW